MSAQELKEQHIPTQQNGAPAQAALPQGYNVDQEAGHPLQRTMSIMLTPEQFEKLYLQPGGQAAKGDLAKRLGNPTALGIISHLLSAGTVSVCLMGWRGANTTSLAGLAPVYLFSGCIGLILAGLLEWVVGNTFPFVVFTSFGGFWGTFGLIQLPSQNVPAAYPALGIADPAFNSGIAIWLVFFGVYAVILTIAALRTNLVFVLLFFTLDICLFLLAGGYYNLSYGNASMGSTLLRVGGGFLFGCVLCGWWILVALIFGSTGVPINVPICDMSNFLSGKKKSV